MKTVTPAPHEFACNLIFAEYGLSPFFAFDSEVKSADGSKSDEILIDGERWRWTLYYQSGNLAHPGDETPAGTRWDLDPDESTDPPTIPREYRIKVKRHPDEDPVGEQEINAHIAPRWPGVKGVSDSGNVTKIGTPPTVGEGINVSIKGSNVEFRRYLELFRLAAIDAGIAGKYFEDVHEASNIYDAERYVRVRDDESGPIHARNGPVASMGHLLENDRSGYRKIVQNDDDEHGRNQPGYYHTATLGQRRVREAFPDHRLPKEVKHYYSQEARSLPEDHPLAHPKVGASFQNRQLDSDETVYWSDLERLERELDQTVLSVLVDAGLDVAPSDGSGPFVESDAYWDVEVDESGPNPVSLDLTQLRHEQESVVVRQIADGLSPVDEEIVRYLNENGGEVSPKDIAEENDRHVDSVRRRLRDGIEDLVDREYGEVALQSEYIGELIHDAFADYQDAKTRVVDTIATAKEAAERGGSETMTAFMAWASRQGIDPKNVRARDVRMKLRFNEAVGDVGQAIREGFRLWCDAGMPEEQYREAQVRFPDGSLGDAWRWIEPG
ncbi:MAG: MarR family transcriptional regulator [Halococcoides sp.]